MFFRFGSLFPYKGRVKKIINESHAGYSPAKGYNFSFSSWLSLSGIHRKTAAIKMSSQYVKPEIIKNSLHLAFPRFGSWFASNGWVMKSSRDGLLAPSIGADFFKRARSDGKVVILAALAFVSFRGGLWCSEWLEYKAQVFLYWLVTILCH